MEMDAFKQATGPGMSMAYVEYGVGEPLLMLHGGESDKLQYESLVGYLPDGIWAISYDQRDCGDTHCDGTAYTLKSLADDAVWLMDALELDKAHVMGMSYGGMLALQVGLHHPERVKSLIVGTAAYSHSNLNSEFAQRLLAMTPEERKPHMIDACLSVEGQKNRAMMEAMNRSLSASSTRPGSIRMKAAAEHDMTGLAQRISAPTLLIYGGDDPVGTLDNGDRLAEEIPDSQLVVIDGARHSLSLEFADETARLVGDWVLSHRLS
jgi:pimeloyl-ACP methyl ester carboxylesterase